MTIEKRDAGGVSFETVEKPSGFFDKRIAVCCVHNFCAMRKNSTLAA